MSRRRGPSPIAAVAIASIMAACAAPGRREPAKSAPSRPQVEQANDQGGAGDAPKDEGAAPATAAPAPPPAPSSTMAPTSPKTPQAMPGATGGATGTVVTSDALAEAQIALEDARKAFAAAGSDCASLCKALSSMTNATTRLCALTESGTPDEQKRCSDARARLDEAHAKVKSTCGTC